MHASSPSAEPVADQPLILIVEDSDDLRASLQQLLELEGYRTHGVADAHAAMPLIERLRPRAAIIDVRLPGMTGPQLIRWMREAFGPGPELLAATGSIDAHDHEEARLAGADHLFLKPLDLDALRLALPPPIPTPA